MRDTFPETIAVAEKYTAVVLTKNLFMSHTILKTMSGSLYGTPCTISQCYKPSYSAGEKPGQNIFYVIDESVVMPANAFWNAVNNQSVKIKGGKR